jgi:hypothetical protein
MPTLKNMPTLIEFVEDFLPTARCFSKRFVFFDLWCCEYVLLFTRDLRETVATTHRSKTFRYVSLCFGGRRAIATVDTLFVGVSINPGSSLSPSSLTAVPCQSSSSLHYLSYSITSSIISEQ